MATKSKIQTDWENNRKNNFVTLSNASLLAKPTTTTTSTNATKGGGITGGDTGYKKSTKKSSGVGNTSAPYKALLTNYTMPKTKVTYTAPTVKAVTPVKIQQPVKDVAAEAYKQKLAANQRRTTNQGLYNDDDEVVSKGASAALSYPTSSNTFSQAMDPEYEYKTYAQQKTEAEQAAREKEAANRKAQEEYNRRLAEQEAIAAQEAAEAEREREIEEALAEQEAAYQAIIDAYNAQAAAQMQMLQNQSGVLNQQYDNNAANLYAQYRRSGLAMPELMAGTATGIADSYTLQNNLNFQNNLVENELERASAQNQLNAQANELQANADLQAAQTAADWAKMAYQQRLAAQNSGTKTTTKDDDDGYQANTVKEVKQYLELQLGMGNNMTRDNIVSILKDLYKAKAISKTLAQDTAAEYGIGLYL